jgi:hypothetical protein
LSWAAWLGREAAAFAAMACAAAGALDPSSARDVSSTQREIQEAVIVSSRRTIDRMRVAGGRKATDEPR